MDGQNIIEITLHGAMTGNVHVLAMKRLVKIVRLCTFFVKSNHLALFLLFEMI